MTKAKAAMALEDYKKNSLSASHIYEEEKYLTLEAYCEKRGSRVTPQALVYGSLGAIVQEKQKGYDGAACASRWIRAVVHRHYNGALVWPLEA
ncbi:hypothetical protein EAH_00026040 [Eimeria acervulina]|uniref:Uncharacterized protein n=1 Tax=Eimeria acervulina TaxID=5801 RepID=U6GSE3_EIMAC|nr:hypothetical protein EAH_00026040 [Eimeria acervulina]CDI82193.1 hypothetical protein EAH_00026040 [Eimeria acervulina]